MNLQSVSSRIFNQILEVTRQLGNEEFMQPMILKVNYTGHGSGVSNVTSFNRELIYNLEHAMHHMVIMKIAIENYFDKIQLPELFGVAYSKVLFQKKQCAQ